MENIKSLNQERLNVVSGIIKGLMKLVESNELKEVESAQPENLKQYELKDLDGNEITYIRDNAGNLASPIEVRDSKGKFMAQSWDGNGWSIDKYIENGVDITI